MTEHVPARDDLATLLCEQGGFDKLAEKLGQADFDEERSRTATDAGRPASRDVVTSLPGRMRRLEPTVLSLWAVPKTLAVIATPCDTTWHGLAPFFAAVAFT